MRITAFLALGLLLAGCTPSATGTAPAAFTPTQPILPPSTSSPTHTPFPTITQAPTATSTPRPTPGPDLSFLYLNQGAIYRHDMNDWSSHPLDLPGSGTILNARMDAPADRLVYISDSGASTIFLPSLQVTTFPTAGDLYDYLALSPDGRYAAYSDSRGLVATDLERGISHLLLPHELNPQDETDNILYFPKQLSPTQPWLWAVKGYYENTNYVLASYQSQFTKTYDYCYSDVDWHPEGKRLAVAVSYSPMAACGEADGIYLIDVREGTASERRVFKDVSLPEPEAPGFVMRDYGPVLWNPDGKSLAFVQTLDTFSHDPKARLRLLDSSTFQAKIIADVDGKIDSLAWGGFSGRLYYTVIKDYTAQIWEFDPAPEQARILYEGKLGEVRILSISPDGQWLAFDTKDPIRNVNDVDSLFLLPVQGGEPVLIPVRPITYHWIPPFIGWLSNP